MIYPGIKQKQEDPQVAVINEKTSKKTDNWRGCPKREVTWLWCPYSAHILEVNGDNYLHKNEARE